MSHALLDLCDSIRVDVALIVPGADVNDLVSLVREDVRLQAIPLPDEACAIAMADGHARRCGRPALVIAPGGPGAAALAPGVAQAAGSGIPLLIVTGRASEHQEDLAWQVADEVLLGAAGAISLRARTPEELTEVLPSVPTLLEAGRSVHLILDQPAQRGKPRRAGVPQGERPTSGGRRIPSGSPADPARFAMFVSASALHAADAIRRTVEDCAIPVLTDMTARGIIPEDHPLALGHLGFGAGPAALAAVGDDDRNARSLVALGAPPSGPVDGTRSRRGPSMEVVAPGSVAAWLQWAAQQPWVADGATARAAWASELRCGSATGLRAPSSGVADGHVAVARIIADELGEGGVLVADAGGAHLAIATGIMARQPRTLIATETLTGMGWGLRAALGAALADPMTPVAALIGDGALHVAGTDLAVASRDRLRVLLVVHENGVLGSTRSLQRPGPRDPALLPPLDPLALAAAAGVPAARCDDADALRSAVRDFVGGVGPRLLIVPVEAPGPEH